MTWFHVAIILCIGNFVAWMVAMYVKDTARGLIGHVITSIAGAFIGGWLMLTLFPRYAVPGMMAGAFVVSVALLYFVRLRKRRPQID